MRQAILLSCVICLLACQPALAATTVRVESPDLVLIVDQTGDVNTLSVSHEADTLTVEDESAPLVAGDGCSQTTAGTVECDAGSRMAVRAELAGGADVARVLMGSDGAILLGEEGDDRLTGGSGGDFLFGGAGNDVATGGEGGDSLLGGPGDDTLHGEAGNDSLQGGGRFGEPTQGIPSGRDLLDAGPGNDLLDDNDREGGEIGPDVLNARSGRDTVWSYYERHQGITVDLLRTAGQGGPGENDTLVNVEVIYGTEGDDSLSGDGDANVFWGTGGANRLRGRGGRDRLMAGSGLRRQVLEGGGSRDVINAFGWTDGRATCGGGKDLLIQGRNRPSTRTPRPTDRGLRIASSCEVTARGTGGRWGVDPVPERLVGRSLTFDRPAGFGWGHGAFLVVTRARGEFAELGRGRSLRHGATVQLPERVARKAMRKGMTLRVELRDERYGNARRMIWSFRLRPSRASP